MRNIVFGLGTLQVIVTTVVAMLLLKLIGYSNLTSFTIAALIALSSTAVVVKVLKEAGAKGIVFGVDEQKITEYQNNIPLSARFNDPLPHMFLSNTESFYHIFYDT